VLWDVIPAAHEVLPEWSEINGYFGDLAELRNCSTRVTADFVGSLNRSAFDVILKHLH
jgi:hypothetical protein